MIHSSISVCHLNTRNHCLKGVMGYMRVKLILNKMEVLVVGSNLVLVNGCMPILTGCSHPWFPGL